MMRLPLTAGWEKWQGIEARVPQKGRAWGGLLILLLILLLCSSGCGAMLPKPEFPTGPTPVIPPYMEALQCLGRLFDTYYDRDQFPLTIAVEPALDKTRGPVTGRDEIPAEITMMVMTALNAIHRHLYVSKGSLTPAEPAVAGTVRPRVAVKTDITIYDRALSSHRKEGNLGFIFPWDWLQGPEVEAEIDHTSSLLAIDMLIFENPMQVAVPFAQATVEMKLSRELRRAGGAIGVYGICRNFSEGTKEGLPWWSLCR